MTALEQKAHTLKHNMQLLKDAQVRELTHALDTAHAELQQ
jgi:hypothetical protein